MDMKTATVVKLITEALPSKDFVVTKETKELIGECCVEFIHLLASEATEICDKETRKTITGDHVIAALKALGFESYVPGILESLGEHNKAAKDREKKSFRLEDSGLTQEELLKSQEELFARARQRLQQSDSLSTPTVELPNQLPAQLTPTLSSARPSLPSTDTSDSTMPNSSRPPTAAISIADLTVTVQDSP